MDRTSVSSSNLVSVGYDENTLILEIEFGENRIYQYLEVPSIVHQELMAASSKGKYFHSNINKQYDCMPI